MKINAYPEFYIFSAAVKGQSEEQAYAQHEKLRSMFNSTVSCIGNTKEWGSERSLIVFGQHMHRHYTAKDIALQFNQESLLYVDQFRNTFIVPVAPVVPVATRIEYIPDRQYIGHWEEITQFEAEQGMDHTFVPGMYFEDKRPRYYAAK